MENSPVPNNERYIKKRRFLRCWRKILLALSCAVVFCTTYALILPAITMEQPVELSEESQLKIEYLVAEIDALPDNDTIAASLAELEAADDMDGYDAYLVDATFASRNAYAVYEAMSDDEKAAVTNADKLLSLEWLYSAQPLAGNGSLTVYGVNAYTTPVMMVRHGTAPSAVHNGTNFKWWNAIVVETDTVGNLYVAKVVSNSNNKLDVTASSEKGFVLFTYNVSYVPTVGQYATVGFDYLNTTGTNTSGYGSVSFSDTAPKPVKPEKDNKTKLETVEGADTSKLIEVNLYDYGTNINDKYNADSNYPGFQQDNGTTGKYTKFSLYGFNFGNNITADLAAGHTNVTNQGGTINTTTNKANSPIENAMYPTLKDGYPALASGTSLDYLWKDNAYAKKMNTQSINGLFIYHPDTGAYTFNSRTNHAQFNADTNTFTLYKQIISSNFMMYPFGNFLPFNDIVHQSAQASTIDKTYLTTIANSAKYKYNQGYGEAYNTLSTRLTEFIALMDGAYPKGWTAADCANEYFVAAGINKSFTLDELSNVYSIDYDEATDFYFGMEMKMNFFQPKNGLTGIDGQQPMVFYFTGDDDVWVYIDGVMFLDLSGIHRHVGGEIDFVNGLVKYYYLDVSTGDVSTEPYKTLTFAEILGSKEGLNANGTFENYSSHSFNFYYMERGAGSGVCRMNFNFPLLRQNSISVTKELELDEGDVKLLGDPDFKFQIFRENGEALFIGADREYTILDASGEEIGTGKTDANGVFAIKANQTAVFDGIDEDEGKYFVRELLDEEYFEQYGTVTVNGTSVTTDYNDVTVGTDSFKGVDSPVKDVSDGSTVFRFNNQVVRNKLSTLSIQKTMTVYGEADAEKSFDFEVTLSGKPLPVGTEYIVDGQTKTVEREGIISLKTNETALLQNILAGTAFTVKETEASAADYAVTYFIDGVEQTEPKAAGTVGVAKNVTAVINNSEKGAQVIIPVTKTLQSPDGREHTYTFTLTQVEADGVTPVESGVTKTLELKIKDTPVTDNFVIDYPEKAMTELPQTFLYRIAEDVCDEAGTVIDASVYLVTVTVTQGDDGLSASVIGITKDGAAAESVSFTNRLGSYELPATGGAGTQLYTIGGLLLIGAALLMYYKSMRGKEDEASD